MVDLAAITAISESAAHIKNTGVASSFDKTEIKTKTITYPAFWEAHLFSEQVKNKTYSGTINMDTTMTQKFETISEKLKIRESQRIQETLFHEKQNIIENSLFGVDLNPNSEKIRFFI